MSGDLQQFLEEFGAPPELYAYLAARGFKALKFFVMAARNDDAFEENIIKPFVAGCRIGES